ncbi:Cytochrome c-554(548) [Roseivivax sp. THAF40]|uniref:c-type cytochrome n=1 Tax=unclassified Roseivivax TaxID=2639302 RepID=UPI001268AA0B|nr:MULTISPECIES: c-type cytochrome [unclassified Roseivivax]QFS82538.1 Cytochrome c-554(548) [Roseivivax sp. THAF197b]QFT46307.1 Cytochrome c-554(548) [Roseivivax sp. THAF40]
MAFKHSSLAVAAVFCLSGVAAHAQDAAQGEEIYQSVCKNCHGPTANGMASYPKLNDKDVAYLTDRLETYRAGDKVGPNSLLMIPHAKRLSDDEIASIAVYVTTAFE